MATATLTVSASAPAGYKYVEIVTPDLSNTLGIAYSLSPTLATSDLIVFNKWYQADGVTTSWSVTISTNGVPQFSHISGTQSLTFNYFIWDESASAYGTTAAYSIAYTEIQVQPRVNNIWQWLQAAEPTPGGVTDKIQKYLTSLGYTGSTNESLYRWLGARGYEGSLADRIYQFEYFNTFRYIDISAKLVLEKFGTDAHVWIPGIGYFNGLQAGNYIDSAGTQAGLVDNPVGLVMDAEGSLGAELVTNGNFSNGLTSWVVQQPTAGSVAVLAGECRFNSTDGSLAYIQQTICTVGRTYLVNLNVVNVSSGLLAISDGSTNYITFNTTGAKSFVFVATSSVFQVKRVSGVTDITIDNISVREVTGAITATQGTTANKPILRRGAVNLLLRSEEFNSAPWGASNASASQDVTTSPTGTQTADSVVENTATSTHRIAQSYTKPASAIAFTFSVYLKANTRTFASIRIGDGPNTSSCDVAINLSTGAIDTPTATGTFSSPFAQVNNVGNDWYRLSLSGTSNTDTSLISIVYLATTLTKAASYLGDGTSGIYLWGAQLELGSTASEYIPTTTAAASSSSGNYYWQFDGSNDSLALSSVPFQTQDDFILVAGIRPTIADATNRRVFESAGVTSVVSAYVTATEGRFFFRVKDDAAVDTYTGSATNVAGSLSVVAARKMGNTKTTRINGAVTSTNSTATGSGTNTAAALGSGSTGSVGPFIGAIYPVIAIKGTVSDADLLVLERWVGSLSGVSI